MRKDFAASIEQDLNKLFCMPFCTSALSLYMLSLYIHDKNQKGADVGIGAGGSVLRGRDQSDPKAAG